MRVPHCGKVVESILEETEGGDREGGWSSSVPGCSTRSRVSGGPTSGVLHATGDHGRFELTGIDRVRTRDRQVAENFIVFDTAAFEARSGKMIPWC
jgi:hypothetical protein